MNLSIFKLFKTLFLGTIFLLILSCKSDPINNILKRNNESTGRMVSKETKFLGAFIINDNFYYKYSVNTCEESLTDFEKRLFEKLMVENLNSSINTLEEFKTLGENDYNIIFQYICDNGNMITDIKYKFVNGSFEYLASDSEWDDTLDLLINNSKNE